MRASSKALKPHSYAESFSGSGLDGAIRNGITSSAVAMTPAMPIKIRIGRYSSSSRSIYPYSPPLSVYFAGAIGQRLPARNGGLEQDSPEENRIFPGDLRTNLRRRSAKVGDKIGLAGRSARIEAQVSPFGLRRAVFAPLSRCEAWRERRGSNPRPTA